MYPQTQRGILPSSFRLPKEILYLGTYTHEVLSATSYSFTGVNFGTASPGRFIVVAVCGGRDAVSNVTGVTIGGISASKITGVAETGTSTHLFGAVVPTGASGTINVTWDLSQVTCSIIVYGCKNLQSNTPYIVRNGGNTSNPFTFTETMDPSTAMLAVFQHRTLRTVVWGGNVGISEDTDYTYHPNAYMRSTASGISTTSGAGRTVTRTANTAPNNQTRQILLLWR